MSKGIDGDAFEWLFRRTSDFYVVDLQTKGIKHAILLDSSKGIIYDSADEYPCHSTTESLRMCCGVGAETLERKPFVESGRSFSF